MQVIESHNQHKFLVEGLNLQLPVVWGEAQKQFCKWSQI
jgi:hypothetical protein